MTRAFSTSSSRMTLDISSPGEPYYRVHRVNVKAGVHEMNVRPAHKSLCFSIAYVVGGHAPRRPPAKLGAPDSQRPRRARRARSGNCLTVSKRVDEPRHF